MKGDLYEKQNDRFHSRVGVFVCEHRHSDRLRSHSV